MTKVLSGITMGVLFMLAAAGCSKAGMDVGSMGKLVSAPQLKAGGVVGTDFGDDTNQQKYLSFSGTCDVHVKSLQIGFQKTGESGITYFDIPSSTDYYAQPTDSTTTHKDNDTDCTDGSFDFTLSLAQVRSFLGLAAGEKVNDANVDYVYLVGVTVIGNTAPLMLPTNGDGGNSPTVATKVNINKSYPAGTTGAGICDGLNVFLADDSGNTNTSLGAALNFSIDYGVNATPASPLTFYSSQENCQNSANALTQTSLPAGSNYVQIYFKTSSADIGKTYNFVVNSASIASSSLTPGASYAVAVRSDSTHRWLEVSGLPYRIYKNDCYSGQIFLHHYDQNRSIDTSTGTSAMSASFGGSSSIEVYGSAGCSGTPLSSVSLNGGSAAVYVKYSGSTSGGGFITQNWSVSGTDSMSSVSIDPTDHNFEIDLTSETAVNKVDFWGPNQVRTGDCNMYTTIARNKNGTVLPASSTLSFTLATTAGSFYSDASCSVLIGSSTIAGGDYKGTIYYRAAIGTTEGDYQFTTTGSGLSSNTFKFHLQDPSVAAALAVGGATTINPGECTPVLVNIQDQRYTNFTPTITTPLNFTISNAVLYGNSTDCGSATNSLSSPYYVPSGVGSQTFYARKSSSGTGSVQFTLPSTGYVSATVVF